MKKRRLKSWVEVALVVLALASCFTMLYALDNAEQKRAYAEGRTQKYYTSTGDVYYK